MRHNRLLMISVLGIALAAAGGCGPRQFSVTGKVTYNGAVLEKPDGRIIFVGPKGEQSAAVIASDGAYEAINVAAGLNRVVVYYPNPQLKELKKKVMLKSGEQLPTLDPFLTPAEYALANATSLSISVEKKTTFDVNLEGPAIP